MKCKGVSHSPGLFCVLAQCVGSLLWFIRCQCWKFCWRLVEPLLISGCGPERKLLEKGSFVVFSVAEVSQVDDYFVQRYFCCFNIRIQFQRSQDTIYIDKKRMQSFANLTNLHFIHSRTQETRKCLSWENSFWIWFQKLMSTKSGQGHVYSCVASGHLGHDETSCWTCGRAQFYWTLLLQSRAVVIAALCGLPLSC